MANFAKTVKNCAFFGYCDFNFHFFALFSKIRQTLSSHFIFYEIFCSSNFFYFYKGGGHIFISVGSKKSDDDLRKTSQCASESGQTAKIRKTIFSSQCITTGSRPAKQIAVCVSIRSTCKTKCTLPLIIFSIFFFTQFILYEFR